MTHLPDATLQRLADSGAEDAHVSACAACRAEVAAYRRLAARLSNLAAAMPPPGFAADVMREIRAREFGSPREIAAILAPALALLLAAAWFVTLPSPTEAWHSMERLALVMRVALAVLRSAGGAPVMAAALLLLGGAYLIRRFAKEERT